MKCKRSIALLALVITLVFVPVVLVQAKKPFRFEVSGALATSFLGWEGQIDSGPLTGMTMIWYTDILETHGSRLYFFERWEIWDEDTLVLAGIDDGATRLKNGKFTGNGKVTFAIEEWGHLLGLKEHLGGTADFTTTPWTFTGTVQIN